jgi:L-gulonolactone oxidase
MRSDVFIGVLKQLRYANIRVLIYLETTYSTPHYPFMMPTTAFLLATLICGLLIRYAEARESNDHGRVPIELTYSIMPAVVNTFDGEGFVTCANVAQIIYAQSVDEVVSIVKNAYATNTPVRALGGGHSWYNTSCSDDPNTIVIKTEYLDAISNLNMDEGSVEIEAGVTFLQLANWLHARNAAIGYTLVNWNISIAGAIAMGGHRSSLREDSMVAASALALDIVNGKGELVHLEQDMSSDTWLAATTSLGLLGAITKVKFKVRPDFKVWANQTILDENDVLNGDIYGLISPYATANL